MIIGGIEERLQLGPGQRAAPRAALIAGHMHRGVPLVHDLHRAGTDLLLALRHPAVPRITRIRQEQRHRSLIRADGRVRPSAFRDPRLDLPGRPLPREPAREYAEPADYPFPPVDQRPGQAPGGLLAPPALQHRLE